MMGTENMRMWRSGTLQTEEERLDRVELVVQKARAGRGGLKAKVASVVHRRPVSGRQTMHEVIQHMHTSCRYKIGQSDEQGSTAAATGG
jgi:hypothetical protein